MQINKNFLTLVFKSFSVYMKRIYGPNENYYLLSNEKSIRENLQGRAIIEYPEFIISFCVGIRLFEKSFFKSGYFVNLINDFY